MKWDIDAEVEALESCTIIPGTTISRVCMDLKTMKLYGVVPTAKQQESRRDGGFAWCLAIGRANEPKAFFYAQTILEAVEKAKKAG